MIRFKLAELLAEKSFNERRRIEWREVAEATGIHRSTLSRMVNTPGYNGTTQSLDALCKYFGCDLGDVAVYLPDDPSVDGGHGAQ